MIPKNQTLVFGQRSSVHPVSESSVGSLSMTYHGEGGPNGNPCV